MDLDALIRSQHGVCTAAQALEGGVTPDGLRWRVASRRWSRIGQGLYRAQTGELDWQGRAHAAVLRGRDGCALSLRAAEFLHGVAPTAPPVITVAVPVGRSVTRLAGTRFRSHVRLEVVRRKGLPVTSAEQTVLDLADVRGVQWREAVGTTARWVQKRRTTPEALADALGQRSRHQHRRILSVALDVEAQGAQSLMEVSYVRRVELPHGLPRASLQVRDGTVRRDFEYPEWLVVLEVDGRLGHEGEFLASDRSRDRRAAGIGRVTLRAGWVDVEGAPCELAVDVHAALRARGYRGPIRACGQRCAVRRFAAA
ncbi:MAG TPA: type IV toxin-antitoxin system AbiEi family antitoxin domain-containing protein [Ornithinibacter sp.]|nr:type IV toxin-antitoxin system AbiEi family antitoxin domain-containing protein [Ornithinibacter sp.]